MENGAAPKNNVEPPSRIRAELAINEVEKSRKEK